MRVPIMPPSMVRRSTARLGPRPSTSEKPMRSHCRRAQSPRSTGSAPMLEMMLCSLVTILPDYLFRRYKQGKRFGHEINLYTVWFELRWGITGCLILTVSLITAVFYNHPATTNVTLFFRTIPILTEASGRVAEIFVDGVSAPIKQGAPLFRLDSAKQEAAMETARRKIAEVDAALIVAKAEVEKADGQLRQAKGALQQAQDELETKQELHRRNPAIVPL